MKGERFHEEVDGLKVLRQKKNLIFASERFLY